MPGLSPDGPPERRPGRTDGEPGPDAVELVVGEGATVFACARCGGTLSRQMPESIHVICRYCGATTSLEDGVVATPPGAIATSTLPPVRYFTIGAFYRHRGLRWQVIGVQRFEGSLRWADREKGRPIDAEYTLWWLINERRELAYLGDHGGTRFWSEPRLPEVARVPPSDSDDHEHGEWTLVDAAGEFPYRVARGERHRSVEHARRREGVSVDTWLDERGEPRRIEFSRTRVLDDEEVLEGLDDDDGLAAVRRWTLGRDTAVASALLALGALVFVQLGLWPGEHDADGRTPVLALAFAAVVVANVCAVRGHVIADERATLALAKAPRERA